MGKYINGCRPSKTNCGKQSIESLWTPASTRKRLHIFTNLADDLHEIILPMRATPNRKKVDEAPNIAQVSFLLLLPDVGLFSHSCSGMFLQPQCGVAQEQEEGTAPSRPTYAAAARLTLTRNRPHQNSAPLPARQRPSATREPKITTVAPNCIYQQARGMPAAAAAITPVDHPWKSRKASESKPLIGHL